MIPFCSRQMLTQLPAEKRLKRWLTAEAQASVNLMLTLRIIYLDEVYQICHFPDPILFSFTGL